MIFLALCQIADVDADDVEPDEDDNSGYNRWDQEPPRSHRENLRRYYLLAKHGSVLTLPRTRQVKARQEAEERAEQEARHRALKSRAESGVGEHPREKLR